MKKTMMIVALALAIVGCGILVISCGRDEFSGERIRNPDSYLANISYMNGTDSHRIRLEKDDVLAVYFKTEKGSLRVKIQSPSGDVIYDGNGKSTTSFEINVTQSGVYSISVEAKRAQGRIHIKIKEK